MTTLSQNEIDEIRQPVEKEFPHDPALQQVHIARKIIACEAEREGLTYFEYIKRRAQQVNLDASRNKQ